jgi:hypothetical protein
MTALLPPTMLVHDEPVNVAGTGQKAFYQPENLVDLSVLSERGAKFTLDVHGIHGTADSWYLTCKFQLAISDVAGSGLSQQHWYDLQKEQIAKLIMEGVDWYGGVTQPYTITNPVTNPSLETASTGWSAIAGTGGTAAGARLTTAGYSGSASYRITWSVATSVNNTGGVGGPLAPVAAGQIVSGALRVRPSRDQWIRANLEFRDGASAVLAMRQGTSTFCPANQWTRVVVENKLAVAGTTQARVTAVAGNGSVAWAAADTLDADANIIVIGATVPSYFDGDSDGGAWLGTAHASASTLLIVPDTPTSNIVARHTDGLPVTVSRTIQRFGRYVRCWIQPFAVNPSVDFEVMYTLVVD